MPLRLLLLVFALAPALTLAQEPAPPAQPAGPASVEPPAAASADPPAPAAEDAVAAPLPAPPAPPPQEAPYPKLGVALGLGVPQAATLDLLYRPLPWLRLSAGPTWDYVGWGLHGGVVLSPFRWAVSPTLGLDAGRMFGADLNKFVSVNAGLQPLLQQVEIQYASATLGLEFGSQRGFAFSLRFGLAWLQAATHGTGRLTDSGGISGGTQATVNVTSPVIRASTPTAQLVFQYFI